MSHATSSRDHRRDRAENFSDLKNFKPKTIFTKYGSIKYKEGEIGGRPVVFLPRHGLEYRPPHLINYRANLVALKLLKVDRIIATAACGSLRSGIKPGDYAAVTDFIDFTKNREAEPGQDPFC